MVKAPLSSFQEYQTLFNWFHYHPKQKLSKAKKKHWNKWNCSSLYRSITIVCDPTNCDKCTNRITFWIFNCNHSVFFFNQFGIFIGIWIQLTETNFCCLIFLNISIKYWAHNNKTLSNSLYFRVNFKYSKNYCEWIDLFY